MRIALIINDIETEIAEYTSVYLGLKMHNLGHEVYFTGVADLVYYPDGHMGATARRASGNKYKTTKTYIKAIKDDSAIEEKITADNLDVLLLRNDPASEPVGRGWAKNASVIFGQLALRHGVIVLNDPNSLSEAVNKMYFQHFPESVRPHTLITRDPKEIQEFHKEQGGNIIMKPLQGSGGAGVFLVKEDDAVNLNQMIEAISRDGYVIAQEYLPKATEGDVRLFVVNGDALKWKGKYAAIRRVNESEDIRSNMSAGGSAEKVKVDDTMLEIVDTIRPKLVLDGMFMVGLDIVGDKLMEINVFSPGGLQGASELQGVDFSIPVIQAIENKVQYRKNYTDLISNKLLATI
ncbi:glutathione synthase [Rhodohalobacter sp. SW132]|uniref:glutathione synthetase n=1 Tax=Rhodohalobacter sp. SW132 TaxID=2293433 RepID=UPI000E273D92|nr:glutathione synthetase [Rhodohalobacter sp. SW132]REL37832.1 glutathione synthase [Rhodohalobacter sp. SW132]